MATQGWASPVVGVLGGMGPAATVAFLDQLVRFTDAGCDQAHIDAIVTQHGSTPPRSDFILHPGGAPDPAPALIADARRLQAAGADMLVIPCNTACYFLPAIQAAVTIPCVSIVDVTAARATEVARGGPIAVFATEGTMAAKLYERAIEAAGGQAIAPSPTLQQSITHLIDDQVKAGLPVDLAQFDRCIAEAQTAGAKVVILGCTELSVIYNHLDARPELVDSLRTLVLHLVDATGKKARL